MHFPCLVRVKMGKIQSKSKSNERADTALREAHQLKAVGSFVEAAKQYETAAKESTRAGDPFSPAEYWQEAAKCWKMADNTEEQERALLKAADLFKKRGRDIRAAGIIKTLSRCSSDRGDKQEALHYLREAAKLFEGEKDGRTWSTLLESYHLLAEMGQYREAAQGFEDEALRILVTDMLLVNQSQRLLLMATLCLIFYDETVAEAKVFSWTRDYSWFASSREGKLAHDLARIGLDPSWDELESMLYKLEEDYKMIATMPAWFGQLWHQKIDDLEKRGPSLL